MNNFIFENEKNDANIFISGIKSLLNNLVSQAIETDYDDKDKGRKTIEEDESTGIHKIENMNFNNNINSESIKENDNDYSTIRPKIEEENEYKMFCYQDEEDSFIFNN